MKRIRLFNIKKKHIFKGNDGPVCRCSNDDRKFGIRHQMFYGEKVDINN
jgi:hypothetical protein